MEFFFRVFSRFSGYSHRLVKVNGTKILSAPSPDFSTTFPLFKMKIGPVVSAPQSVTDGRTNGRTNVRTDNFSRWHILDQGVPRITGNPKSQNRKFSRLPNFPYYYIKTHVYSVCSVFYSSRNLKTPYTEYTPWSRICNREKNVCPSVRR